MRIVELKIRSWEKHNPRSDVKTARWFKMSNEFFSDPEFYGISLEARQVWIYLLCVASKKSSGLVKVNTQMIADNLRVSVDSIDYALIELEKCGSVITSPVTLVSDNLESERKDKVTNQIRALEEKREEEKREEEIREDKKREEECSEQASQSSKPTKLRLVGHIPEFEHPPIIQALLKNVLQETQALWLQTYQDVPWITSEFIKIVNWLQVNPRKRPKSGLDRFISSWLSRGWESHRKTLPSGRQTLKKSSRDEVTASEIEEAKQLGIL